MAVDRPQRWDEFIGRADLPGTRFVLHTGPGLARLTPPAGGAAVAVGPECGFTDEELTAAQAAGWRRASLGPRVLRVETAAIAAAGILGERGA